MITDYSADNVDIIIRAATRNDVSSWHVTIDGHDDPIGIVYWNGTDYDAVTRFGGNLSDPADHDAIRTFYGVQAAAIALAHNAGYHHIGTIHH